MGLSSLRSSADFERVFAERRRLFKNGLTVYYRRGATSGVRLGIVTPKRFGKAVQRNLFRRRVREIVRRYDEAPIGCDLIVCVNRPLAEMSFPVLQEALHWSFQRTRKPSGGPRSSRSSPPPHSATLHGQ